MLRGTPFQAFLYLQHLNNLYTSFVSHAYSLHRIKTLANTVLEAVVVADAKYSGKHSVDIKIDFHVLSHVQMQLPVTQTICIV